jgi:CubicO group peptidase (beta-lactamase class C family)
MKYKKTVAVTVLIGVFFYFTYPIYQFYTHKHKAPMLTPWGYESLPQNAPQNSKVYQPHFTNTAEKAQQRIGQHRAAINAPGLSIAVAIDQELVWAGASGWADVATNSPMTPDTIVRIGSTSKALTAAGLARMVQAQAISLDRPLSAIFTELPNQAWADITPRQLASHSAGMPHYKENTDYYGLLKSITLNGHYENVDDAVRLFDGSETLSAPGEKFYYSSLGTVLLSAAMQSSVATTYQQWMQEQVLTPLAMHSTLPEQPLTSLHHTPKDQQVATFYWQEKGEQGRVRKWRDVDLSHRLAGGGWLSTSKDLVKLGQGFIDYNFIATSIKDEFWTPQVLNSGKANHQNYGIGWRVHTLSLSDDEEVTYAHHGGVSRGAQSFLVVVPKYKLSLALNINSNTEEFNEFGSIAGEIIRLFIAERKTQIEENAEGLLGIARQL